jgi:hypothetical protein
MFRERWPSSIRVKLHIIILELWLISGKIVICGLGGGGGGWGWGKWGGGGRGGV